MSGPRPRMGSYYMMFKIHAPQLLCQKCDPSPGWGWYIAEDNIYSSWKNNKQGALPPPGNGYTVDGQCKHCDGIGIGKEGRFNAGSANGLGMGAHCVNCDGRGTTFTFPAGTTSFTFDDRGKSDAVHSPCKQCEGTGRDEIPWSELFSKGID